MHRDILAQHVTTAFQFGLDTLVEYLELRHDDAQEFKSIRIPVELKHPTTGEALITDRWGDPPEKKLYFNHLRETLKEFVTPGQEDAARQLFDPIIELYYSTCRARRPTKGKVKEPVRD